MPRKKKTKCHAAPDDGAAGNNDGRRKDGKVTFASQASGQQTQPADDILPINEKFAQHYEVSKRRQFLSNAPAALLNDSDDSSSTSEEEDEFGELLTKGIDRQVKETLQAIRSKDPKIYDRNTRFFEPGDKVDDGDGSGADEDEGDDADVDSEDEPVAGWDTIARAARQGSQKLTLKDYVRETLLKDGKLSDSDDDDAPAENDGQGGENGVGDELDSTSHGARDDMQSRSEGAGNNAKLSNMLCDDESEEQIDGGDSDVDFFTKKDKSQAELDEEEKDFEVFMKKRASRASGRAGEDLLLHSYLENEKPDEKERFLRDFVLNNGWLDRNAGEAPDAREYEIEIDHTNPDDDGQDVHNEDEFDEEVDNFESQYNFRFEDPEGTQIVSHARNVPDSMRRPDTRRKRAREARRQRKEQEKAEKTGEIKRLKNLKKREIETRLLAIQEAAGEGLDVTGIDLDGDFDPDQFNKQMESKFGDDYYAMKDEEMKDEAAESSHASEKRRSAKHTDDMPEDVREDVNRLVDEYYNLDYEDIVGGIPMRFKYKHVDPESFNLSTEDILNMDDKDLNRLVSLKYLAPYRARRDIQKQAWRVRTALQKRSQGGLRPSEGSGVKRHAQGRLPRSSQNGSERNPTDSTERKDETHAKPEKVKKRRKQGGQDPGDATIKTESKHTDPDGQGKQSPPDDLHVHEHENGAQGLRNDAPRKKKGKKRRKTLSTAETMEGLSESRQKAYGMISRG